MKKKEYLIEEVITKDLRNASEHELTALVREIIFKSIIESNLYLDSNDIESAADAIYPIACDITLNPKFDVRDSRQKIEEVVNFLVSKLA